MAVYRLPDDEIIFPYPELAEENGLLAVGGDLSMERLLLAYSNGIFPWFDPEDEIMWWCPKQRFIIRPGHVHVSRSMKKFGKKHAINIVLNRDFRDTMHRCRMQREDKEGTWISDDMEEAYFRLYEQGYAISVESFFDGELAGGLYGVVLGRCFFGESMFSKKENGSKAALIMLSNVLKQYGFLMIDCQLHTDHLESMGGEFISWEEYKHLLEEGLGV